MTWAYLVVFNDALGTPEEVQELLDGMPEVTHWYRCMPHCVFFTCTAVAGTIADRIYTKFGKGAGRFLVVDVHQDRQGWLPKKAWHMFLNPDTPELDE